MRRLTTLLLSTIVLGLVAGAAHSEATPQEVASSKLKKVDLEVFMFLVVDDAQIDGVRSKILASGSTVRRFAFIDHDAAYRTFQKRFKDQPELTKDIRPQDLPVSFRLVARDGASVRELDNAFSSLAGVDNVASTADLQKSSYLPPGESCASVAKNLAATRNTVEVIMTIAATDDEIAAVRAIVEEAPEVVLIHFVDHDEALDEFTHLFKDNKDLVDGVRAEDLPVSFRITFEKGKAMHALASELEAQPGVGSFSTPKQRSKLYEKHCGDHGS